MNQNRETLNDPLFAKVIHQSVSVRDIWCKLKRTSLENFLGLQTKKRGESAYFERLAEVHRFVPGVPEQKDKKMALSGDKGTIGRPDLTRPVETPLE